MTLLSALEDLQKTTLRVIRGSLRRLEYLAQLRDIEGDYRHWGLARVHGQERACSAIEDSHRSQLSRILSTPIRERLRDVGLSSKEAGLTKEECLARLVSRFPHLLPANSSPGSNLHLSSVLHALSSLLRAENQASIGESENSNGATPIPESPVDDEPESR